MGSNDTEKLEPLIQSEPYLPREVDCLPESEKDRPSLASRTYNNLLWEPQEEASLSEHPLPPLRTHLSERLDPQGPSFIGDQSRGRWAASLGRRQAAPTLGIRQPQENLRPLWGWEHGFFFEK